MELIWGMTGSASVFYERPVFQTPVGGLSGLFGCSEVGLIWGIHLRTLKWVHLQTRPSLNLKVVAFLYV